MARPYVPVMERSWLRFAKGLQRTGVSVSASATQKSTLKTAIIFGLAQETQPRPQFQFLVSGLLLYASNVVTVQGQGVLQTKFVRYASTLGNE